MITSRPFSNLFAILPSSEYIFLAEPPSADLSSDAVLNRRLRNGVDVTLVNLGLIVFDFTDSDLKGFPKLDIRGGGVVPDEVRENEAALVRLQSRRMRLAVFVAACIIGCHAHATHSSLRGPLFPALDEVYGVFPTVPGLPLAVSQPDWSRLSPQLRARGIAFSAGKGALVPFDHAQAGLDLVERLLDTSNSYVVADPTALIVMTYQAVLLHARQHAGASLALGGVVVEAAVEEMIYAYGLVEGVLGRLSETPKTKTISRRRVGDLGHGGRVQALVAEGVIDPCLRSRMDELRKARNALMHDAQDPVPAQSGDGLTVLRDLLRLCTGEAAFNLNHGYTYRL